MALHNAQELDNDLRRRANEDLALAPTLSVDDVVLGIGVVNGRSQPQTNYTHEAVVLIGWSALTARHDQRHGLTKTDTRTMTGEGNEWNSAGN